MTWKLLQKIMSKSKYVLLSYAYVPKTAMSDDLSYITEIKRRAMGNGWRNHLTNEDLLKLLSRVGVVSGLDSWNGNQTLYLVRNFKVVA